MEITGQEYFDFCHHLFLKREAESDSGCLRFISIAGQYVVAIRFAGEHLVGPVMQALAHLSCPPVADPDLTICVWDNALASDTLLLYPFGRDTERSRRHTCGNIQLSADLYPSRVSLLDAQAKLALFWVNDVRQYPWYERCRPLRNILHWWALSKHLYMVHAACIATNNAGALITGHKGAGKSTTALSALNHDLLFAADDLCLVGFEGNRAFAYSIFNTGKLESFERLPQLEHHAFNKSRTPGEKAFLYVSECFPAKMILRVPLVSIVLPELKKSSSSTLQSISSNEAFHTLTGSTSEELGGASAADFFGTLKICKALDCYRLNCGDDLTELNSVISSLIKSAAEKFGNSKLPLNTR